MTSVQKRLAAQVLKVGVSRIWLDPKHMDEIKKAITKADIRRLIKKGYIKTKPAKKNKRRVKKRRRYAGSKKGGKYSIVSRKRRWINTVRPLRRMLRELKDKRMLDNKTYRYLRRLVKGGMFRSRSHLRFYLEQHGLLKSENNAKA